MRCSQIQSYWVYPRQPPLSPSKRNNHPTRQPTHPNPLPTPFHVTTSLSNGILKGGKSHSKYHCQVCNAEDICEVPTKSPPPRLDYVACTEMVLGILQAHGLTLGDFIITALDQKIPFR